ncbi:MAG: class I SAM-dependent methyltransferase [bacterium]|nr:class I SAM-dependent methyltransferase [bacterium]
MKTNQKNKWEELYKEGGRRGKYPNEDVIRFIQKYFPDREARKNIKILDWGCGTGRHVFYLAKEGFSAYGAEVSVSAVKITNKWLAEEKLKAQVDKINGLVTPYPDHYFDAIIECAVLQHNRRGQIKKIISEMERILKPGGRIFSLCKTKRDSLYKGGARMEKDTYYIKNFVETQTIIHFFDKKELKSQWRQFGDIKIEYTERTINNMARKVSHFIVSVRK